MASNIKYLSQQESKDIDEELFTQYKFSLDQLMELAGYSCAVAIYKVYPVDVNSSYSKVLICCGPGNNGGDGLVCARHLKLFGYQPVIFYPKRTDKKIYHDLVNQCQMMDIAFINALPETAAELNSSYGLVVDAIFGFSFSGEIRPPFKDVLNLLGQVQIPVCSIDVPSGWDLEKGCSNSPDQYLKPEMLISLTAPKLCSRYFDGKHHFLGGRFVPRALHEKYQLNLPPFPQADPCVRLK